MYGYIRTGEIEQLILNNRNALVVTDVKTRDIDEYINNCLAVLGNYGLNLGLLNQPKIKHFKTGEYIIIFTFRQNVVYSEKDINAISVFRSSMGNVSILKEYYKKIKGLH